MYDQTSDLTKGTALVNEGLRLLANANANGSPVRSRALSTAITSIETATLWLHKAMDDAEAAQLQADGPPVSEAK